MKKLIAFDLDGTLAESKYPLDAEMAELLTSLLDIVKVTVISGAAWPQFDKQVLVSQRVYSRVRRESWRHDFNRRHKPDIDKAYGIQKLRDTLGIAISNMTFVGDAIFPGGNDYPDKQAGARSICVRDPQETKRVIEVIIACLSDMQVANSTEVSYV